MTQAQEDHIVSDSPSWHEPGRLLTTLTLVLLLLTPVGVWHTRPAILGIAVVPDVK